MTEDKKLTCLIIEDEPIAAEVLEDYISQISFLELRGICKDALFALDHLKQEKIDVIFLDIHLPKLKGLDFLKSLEHKPQTILTTAYHQYAIDAFEEGVIDYLMKPIEFSRFLKAVNKLKWRTPIHNKQLSQPVISKEKTRPFRFFNVNKKKMKIYYDEILYIESLKDYSRIVTFSTAFVVRGNIGEIDEQFKPHRFLRIHRSYIVSINRIKAYAATEIEVEGKALPVGRSYREIVAKVLGEYLLG